MPDEHGNRQPDDRGRRQPGEHRSLERLDWCVAQIERELDTFTRHHEHEAVVKALQQLSKRLRDLNKRLRDDYPQRTEIQRDYLSRGEYAQSGEVRRDTWLKAPLIVIAALQLLTTILVLTQGGSP